MNEEKDYPWKKEQELILKKWADKGLCFKLMHDRAYKKYRCLNAWFNIPIIIISTITGTGNFASINLEKNITIVIFIIGAFNIFAAILATISNFIGINQKLESHRIATISWDKFARKIQIELLKSRVDRYKAKYYIKKCMDDYDRLIEISPIIPNDIIKWFMKTIELGYFEEMNECSQCCYDYFCFPCGCNICLLNKNKQIIHNWTSLELPEIVGRIRPTEILNESSNEQNHNEQNHEQLDDIIEQL